MTGVYATMRLKLCKKGLGLVCYWVLKSQFAPVYMHFNINFLRCLWEDMNISKWKNGDRTFFSLEFDDRLLLMGIHSSFTTFFTLLYLK